MSVSRRMWFIARKDLRYMLRQRETILWTFVMPIIFFYLIGTITGGFARPDAPDDIVLDAPPSSGFLTDQMARRLEERGYRVVRADTGADSSETARRLAIPAAFTDSVLAGRQTNVVLSVEEGGIGLDYDRVRVGRAVYTVLADVVVSREEGADPTPEALQSLAALPRALTLEVAPAGRRKEIPSGFSQAIPGTMVMFTMLVMLTGGSVLLVSERGEGLLRRLAATPISRGEIVTGKWLGRMALGLVQIVFAMLTGSILFGMNWGPDLPMVGVVLAVYAGFNASLALVLGSLARNQAQVVAIGVLSANVLAALGGCWWPIEVTPDWMQTLQRFVPTGWAMDAMHRLVNFEAGATSAAPHLLVTLIATLVTTWLASRVFRFE